MEFNFEEMKKPTEKQNELLRISAGNFIEKSPKQHRQLLSEFVRGKIALHPDTVFVGLTLRVLVIDYIWNHYCRCDCKG